MTSVVSAAGLGAALAFDGAPGGLRLDAADTATRRHRPAGPPGDRAGEPCGKGGNVSIQVRPDELQPVLADFDAGYLLTVDPATARVKVVSVRPTLVNGVLIVAGPGRGSLANVRANAAVTLVWPPMAAGGFSLIVDGSAECSGDDVRVTPTGGVLHKPA